MRYVYVLKSKKDSHFYTGCTGDLKKRIREHNSGKVVATKNRQPLILVYYEAFLNRSDAFAREQWLKTGWGRTHLQKILANYLKNWASKEIACLVLYNAGYTSGVHNPEYCENDTR